jgi:hypothetical protein
MPIAIVAGALANKPFNGGEAWVRLSWLLGLRRLGFDAHFVEQLASANCVDEHGAAADFQGSANLAYFESVVGEFELGDRASLLCDGGREAVGPGVAELEDLAGEAELLVNISGHLTIPEILRAAGKRLYIDLDPGFTQAWHVDRAVPFALEAHDHYATVGLNVGRSACPIPDCGIRWLPTLPPVVLEEWPSAPAAAAMRFTTVARWRSPYGPPAIGGRTMELKHHRFRRLLDLPQRLGNVVFEIALDIDEGDRADREALVDHGWAIVDPREAAGTPRRFREYVSSSGAELSVAQGVYSETASGWFSDRTAVYLASGRPALVEDTGVGGRLPTGRGLLVFASLDEAVAGAEEMAAASGTHGAAARAFAEEHLDSDLVLARLLAAIGVGG